MKYEKQFNDLEGELKMIGEMNLCQERTLIVVKQFSRLRGQIKEYGCGCDCTQNRAVATEPDFCGDGILCCGCEELTDKIDALLGLGEQ